MELRPFSERQSNRHVLISLPNDSRCICLGRLSEREYDRIQSSRRETYDRRADGPLVLCFRGREQTEMQFMKSDFDTARAGEGSDMEVV